jgi:hypothetical protein
VEQILCEWFLDRRRIWLSKLKFCVLESLVSAIPCFVVWFGDHTGNTTSHHPLQLSQARNDHHTQIQNKLLTSLQSESLLFIGQTVRN